MNRPRSSDQPLTASTLARLPRNPGAFTLVLDDHEDANALLACDQVVRAIPGVRLVCTGKWRKETVYIKLYIGMEKLYRREIQGLNALHAAGVAAPAIRYHGTADHGAIQVILLQPVQPAVTLEAALKASKDAPARIELLGQALETIARHHQAGLEQLDIHLDNFLVCGGRLYTLDGGGIHVCPSGELSAGHALDNLALFFAQFYPENDRFIEMVLPHYEQRRGFRAGTVEAGLLHERVGHFRRERLRRYLKKVFRNCSAFICRSSPRRFMVCDRAMAGPEMLALLADPDASLRYGQVEYLKKGNTCTLWRTRVGAHTLVIKRYNLKGFMHRLSRMLRTTRAAVSWENAHRLGFYGISTPKPVALVEERLGPLRGRAWYVSEYAAGDNAMDLCTPGAATSMDVPGAAAALVGLLKQLANSNISHGDMKGTNLILTPEGATVIDLDAMKQHVNESGYRRSQQRDLDRFMRNWEQCPDTAAIFKTLLRTNGLVNDK